MTRKGMQTLWRSQRVLALWSLINYTWKLHGIISSFNLQHEVKYNLKIPTTTRNIPLCILGGDACLVQSQPPCLLLPIKMV